MLVEEGFALAADVPVPDDDPLELEEELSELDDVPAEPLEDSLLEELFVDPPEFLFASRLSVR